MGNKYVQAIFAESRRGDNILECSDCDYLDVVALSAYVTKLNAIKLKDESFNFDEFSKMTAKIYRLFLTLDKLDCGVNKGIVKLILNLSDFTSKKTSEKKICLIQSLLKRMVIAFLGDCLTSKPRDAETLKPITFDKADKEKEYSVEYFSFVHLDKRYTVKTDTFDLSSILSEL